MNNIHKHISYEQLLWFLRTNEFKHYEKQVQGCESCLLKLNKAKQFLQNEANLSMGQVEEKFREIQSNIKEKDDLLAYLKQARPRVKEQARLKKKATMRLASIAALFLVVLTFVVNYQYSLFAEKIALANAIEVERPGLFWGGRHVVTSAILPEKDLLSLQKGATLNLLGRFTFYTQANVSFHIINKNSIKLSSGEVLIHFQEGPSTTRVVTLPTLEQIHVTGTTIYFNLSQVKQVAMVEGSALLKFREIHKELKEGLSYDRQGQKVTSAKELLSTIKVKYKESLKQIFPDGKKQISNQLPRLNWQHLLQKKTELKTSQQDRLFRKYKNIYRIDFIEGGYFIAARKKASKTKVTYVLPSGKVTIPINAIAQEIQIR